MCLQIELVAVFSSCLTPHCLTRVDQIELIADESTSVYRDFPPEEMKRLLTEVPKILIRVAQVQPATPFPDAFPATPFSAAPAHLASHDTIDLC